MEKLRHLDRVTMQGNDDPHGLNKSDPNKVWNYFVIQSIIFSEYDDFSIKSRKCYATDNIDFNQLEFPINYSLFVFPRFKLTDNYKDKEDFKNM